MSNRKEPLLPSEYLVENAANFSLLGFVQYFDFENEKDAKAVLSIGLKNASSNAKVKKKQRKKSLFGAN